MLNLIVNATLNDDYCQIFPNVAEIKISDELLQRIIELRQVCIDSDVYQMTIFNNAANFIVIDEDEPELRRIYGKGDEDDQIDVMKLIIAKDYFKWAGWTKHNGYEIYTDNISYDKL